MNKNFFFFVRGLKMQVGRFQQWLLPLTHCSTVLKHRHVSVSACMCSVLIYLFSPTITAVRI